MKKRMMMMGALLAVLLSPMLLYGQPNAELDKAMVYYNNQNYTEALRIFRAESQKGNYMADAQLGMCYYMGLGVNQNYPEAFRYFKKSYDAGLKTAAFFVGMCYSAGTGVTKNDNSAFRYFKVAADAGSAPGMFSVGRCYFFGLGVPQDANLGIDWLKKAAAKGEPQAADMLKQMENKTIVIQK